jgi:hypothetical protein
MNHKRGCCDGEEAIKPFGESEKRKGKAKSIFRVSTVQQQKCI